MVATTYLLVLLVVLFTSLQSTSAQSCSSFVSAVEGDYWTEVSQCSPCVTTAGCGYCLSTLTCLDGTVDGPSDGKLRGKHSYKQGSAARMRSKEAQQGSAARKRSKEAQQGSAARKRSKQAQQASAASKRSKQAQQASAASKRSKEAQQASGLSDAPFVCV